MTDLGGGRRVILNTNERIASADLVRGQALREHDLAEALRYLADVDQGTDDDACLGYANAYATTGDPLRAEILSGLMVQPQVGSLHTVIQDGALYAVDSITEADASPYRYVRSDGVADGSTLLLTANASGSTRIDVVECSLTRATVESGTRDVFDPSTGLAVPRSVQKLVSGGLTFRIRAGTPNAGFPGTQSGWLPLMVASVPTGTTTWDTVTCWDVRPLVSDRAKGVSNVRRAAPAYLRQHLAVRAGSLSGLVEVVGLDGRTYGGRTRRGTPGTDADAVDLTDAANQDTSFSGASKYFVYLCAPLGLPRWARYTDSGAGQRVPRASRGIVIASRTAPDEKGTATVTLPASVLGTSTACTGCVCVLANNYPGGFTSATQDGRDTHLATSTYSNVVSGVKSGNHFTFTFVPGTDYPKHARRVRLSIALVITGSGGATGFIQAETTLRDSGDVGDVALLDDFATSFPEQGSGGWTISRTLWIPLPQATYGTATNLVVRFNASVFQQTSATLASATAGVTAYGAGP